MAAYVIHLREQTIDPVELERYVSQVGETLEGYGVKFLALFGEQRVLEGPDIEGALIAEFPTLEAAEAWYSSAAYQAIVGHRHKATKGRFLIVSGT